MILNILIKLFSGSIASIFLLQIPADAQAILANGIGPKIADSRCMEKDYRHKTASQLERMSAEELIDESERHWNYHGSLMDDYGMFILDSYKEKIGIKIIPVLAELAANFESQPHSNCQQQRFFTAFAIAADVDDQVVRLRSREDGRTAIAAVVAALRQMAEAGLAKQPYSKYPFGLYLLESVLKTNDHDGLMRELLSDEYGVKLTDDEFIDFVMFLTKTYPSYPSWTPRIKSGRDLRGSKKKYHTAFLEYKRDARNSSLRSQ